VPPSRSTTSAAASASATSGLRFCNGTVIRVSRVPKQNTSTLSVDRRAEYANCSSARE
jgi:hypothetical protein